MIRNFVYCFLQFFLQPIVMSMHISCIRKYFLHYIFGVSMGKYSSVLRNSFFFTHRNKIKIGNHSVINSSCILDGRGGHLVIGNNVDIARETNIWTLQHDPQSDCHGLKGGDVYIDDYVWIASRCTILPGIRIGKGAVIASGSVVTKDVPPMSIVAGIPAKVIGQRKSELKYSLNYKPYFA